MGEACCRNPMLSWVRSLLKGIMLSPDHKAALLRRAGFPVPAAPVHCTARFSAARNEPDSTRLAAGGDACDRWRQSIDALFVAHSIARAMRSLQQEELRLRDAVAHYLPPQSRSASPEDV